jgi:hypothetical protein
MTAPAASAYIVRDIRLDSDPGGWRWASRHPELRFFLPETHGLSFRMDFIIPGAIVKEVGAVTLRFRVNGAPLGEERFDKSGELRYLAPVPDHLLRAGAVNTVSIEPDKTWHSPDDGQDLSFLLGRAGFVE